MTLLVYGELRRLAAARLSRQPPGQTIQATGFVHEAYLRRLVSAMNEPDSWNIQDTQAARLGAILLEARRCATPEARERYLDQACAHDPELRAQAVSLLEAEAAAGDFLGQTVLGDPSEPEAEAPGTLIGPYKLLEKIGEGGFGSVYVAEQEKPIQRRVALKIIKLGMDTRQVVARFEAERQALARMDHPNIAQVFDAGATASGRPYFVMELVRGLKITDYCDRHRLNPQARLALFTDICHAVQHAHQKGIIHRDLKPSNILVAQHDTVAVPKVIDFGIAKATQGRLTEKTLYTGWTQMVGTPVYMSPEQAEFSGLDVDTRSDIYGLGVLLYELLTGRTPFEQKTVLQAGLEEIRRLIREVEPARPSTRLSGLSEAELDTVARARGEQPPKLIGLVQGDLDWIVMKCLEKDRSRRYETANGLAQDIARHLGHEPILARPPSKVYQFQKWARRNKGVFVAGSAVAAAVAMIAVVSTVAAIRERQHSTLLGQSRQQAIERSLELQEGLARQYLQKGQQLAEQRHVAQGLHWMVRAIEGVPPDKRELKQAIADNLVAWSHEWIEPERLQRLDGGLACWAMIPGDQGVLVCTWNGNVTHWPSDLSQVLWTTNVNPGRLWGLAISPDGERFVVGLMDEQKGQLRAIADGRLLGELVGHEKRIVAVTFSPDGQRILTGAWDGTGRLWSGQDGTSAAPPLRHTAGLEVWGVAFSPDSQMALTGSNDGNARFWSAKTGQELGPPLWHGTNIHAVAFSPDGKTVATAGQTTRLRLWSADTRQELTDTLSVGDEVLPFHFSPDGAHLLTGGREGITRLWSLGSRELPLWMAHPGAVTLVMFSPDGQALLTASAGTVRLWSAQTAKPLEAAIPAITEWGFPAAWFGSDGRTLIGRIERDVLALWPVQLKRTRTIDRPGLSKCVGFTAGDRLFAHGWISGEVNFASTVTGELVGEPIRHGYDAWAIAFSPDRRRMLTGGRDGRARLWDVETRQSLGVTLTHSNTVWGVDWSPDGSLLATGSEDGTAHTWSTNGQSISGPLPHVESVRDVALSSDGSYLLTACQDGHARLWDARTGHLLRTLAEHPSLSAADISPKDDLVATAGGDHTVRLWCLASGAPTGVILSHDAVVNDVAFHPYGRWLITTTFDGTAQLWSVTTGERIGPARKHDAEVSQGVFSPDGAQLATAHHWGATVWPVAPPAPDTLPHPRLWVETLTHAKMDAGGKLHWLEDEEVLTRKARLNTLGGPPTARSR